VTLAELEPLAAPGTYPIPPNRGRWRLTLHRRSFSSATWDQTILNELMAARSRSLTQQWNQPAELKFTINGRSADAAAIQELQHDIYAWRWDDQTGADVCVFRGPIDHSEDQLSEDGHVVNFVAHDYLATLNRRFLLVPTSLVIAGTDQDQITAILAAAGGGYGNTMGYAPGSIVPVAVVLCAGDGTTRPVSGQVRDRTYLGQKAIGEAITQLATVIGGFDVDVLPDPAAADTATMIGPAGTLHALGAGLDALRVFYPAQGVNRTDMVFQYGGNVAALTRNVNSGDYANYVRSLGNNGSSDPNAAQMFSQQSNSDASAAVVGFWPLADSAPTDVNQQATLDQRAQGLLTTYGVLVPSYSLTLRPGTYSYGFPRMGDTVPLIVQSGRLNVNTTVRVLGLAYDIGDDGDENVAVTVNRPETSIGDLLARMNSAVDALGRR